jgi:hypothetical protein
MGLLRIEEFLNRFNLPRAMVADKFANLIDEDTRKVNNVNEQDLALPRFRRTSMKSVISQA